ncbi:DUF4178 domain-containing protein [Chondrinema litorale]|uniref:DUF4178 domain-containing protein n=1 Tax=Chondrinema litorale TaxID=2994555 RepID=UPI002542B89A|nr:DUF4178 domain-containing protein [Chondrinema litorale]UZR94632.1 DUF4178 domain-containing protein [Chondrinema litorale]
MAFGFFKKKKKEEENRLHYDPTNIHIRDIRKNFILDYDLKTWEVEAEYEYDWGNEYFTYEYKLVCADDAVYLYVEEDDDLYLTISRKISFGKLGEDVEDSLRDKGRPPKIINYDDKTFYRESERPGYFKNVESQGESEEFVNWEYVDESEEWVLNIEQWDEEAYEASIGKFVDASSFSNILPA